MIFVDLVSGWYRKTLARYEHERASYALQESIVSEASQLVVDRPDRDGFVRMYGQNDREKGHIQSNQLESIRKAREFERWNAEAHGIIQTIVNFVMGKGLTITPKSDDPLVWLVWREFWTAERNSMAIRQFELVKRFFRDGEVFIELFDEDQNGRKTGKTTVRFVDPLLVRAPTGSNQMPNEVNKNGIETDPDDIETVIGYHVQLPSDETRFRFVPAERMIHIKMNADSDQKRGEPFLQSIMAMIKDYEQWLENRIILNKMRSAIVLIKSVEGTPSEVARMAATIPNASNTRTGETKKQNFRGGTMITEGPGVKYRMEAPNINAGDVKEDGRNIKLSMAAGTNLPEYIFGDASNANFSSTLVAESPFVKSIQFWQIFLEFHLQRLYKKVIENAVAAGVLEAPNDREFMAKVRQIADLGEGVEDQTAEEDPREKALAELMPKGRMETPSEIFFGVDMTWPDIVHRDFKAHVDALVSARAAGWVADSTACSSIGFDYSEEVRKQSQIETEANARPNPLLGKTDGEDDSESMDREEKDLKDDESDDESDDSSSDDKTATAKGGSNGTA